MRPSNVFFFLLTVALLLFVWTQQDARMRLHDSAETLRRNAGLVAELGLTDLALFTEARYTRHLSQADLHSAFQDHPLSLEHFPSGSYLLPPPGLRR